MKTRTYQPAAGIQHGTDISACRAVSAFAAETGSNELDLTLTLMSKSQRPPPMICCPAKMHRGIL